ncbi:MAG: DUF1329 domain-containing protein [Deltaproteobacteria bacterium]|nr:DUF1329 domain-containing protein [Deltaproteobacteria bacterium]
MRTCASEKRQRQRSFTGQVLIVLLLAAVPTWRAAAADGTQEKLGALFFPYRQGTPKAVGVTPGLKIDTTNVHLVKEVLPPELLDHVAAGEFSFTIQDTTDTPLRQEYIDATVRHYGKAVLGGEELQNYEAGLPFPLLDPQDPQVGLKGAWNYRYRDRGDSVQYWPTNEHRTGTGAVERSETFYIAMMFGPHSAGATAAGGRQTWERQGVYAKRYMRFVAPSDAEGRQVMSLTYENDLRSDDQWLYDPRTRRTRKVVYNPYEAPGNGQLLAEDTSGFNGYIHAYDWTYIGEKVVLAPSPIHSAEPTLGGKGNWYPTDPWELRKAIVLEAKSRESHPLYSRRLLYLDVQTYSNLYTFAYDLNGKHRRTFLQVYFHPQFNPWNNTVWLPQISAQLSIDYERERASIFQTHKVVYNEHLNENRWFSIMALMLHGK